MPSNQELQSRLLNLNKPSSTEKWKQLTTPSTNSTQKTATQTTSKPYNRSNSVVTSFGSGNRSKPTMGGTPLSSKQPALGGTPLSSTSRAKTTSTQTSSSNRSTTTQKRSGSGKKSTTPTTTTTKTNTQRGSSTKTTPTRTSKAKQTTSTPATTASTPTVAAALATTGSTPTPTTSTAPIQAPITPSDWKAPSVPSMQDAINHVIKTGVTGKKRQEYFKSVGIDPKIGQQAINQVAKQGWKLTPEQSAAYTQQLWTPPATVNNPATNIMNRSLFGVPVSDIMRNPYANGTYTGFGNDGLSVGSFLPKEVRDNLPKLNLSQANLSKLPSPNIFADGVYSKLRNSPNSLTPSVSNALGNNSPALIGKQLFDENGNPIGVSTFTNNFRVPTADDLKARTVFRPDVTAPRYNISKGVLEMPASQKAIELANGKILDQNGGFIEKSLVRSGLLDSKPMNKLASALDTGWGKIENRWNKWEDRLQEQWGAMSLQDKVNLGLNTATSVYNLYNSNREYKLLKQGLEHQINNDNVNYEMAKRDFNRNLTDRQEYRLAYHRNNNNGLTSSPDSVSDYLAKYGA